MMRIALSLCLISSAGLYSYAKATPAEGAVQADQSMSQSQSLTISEVIDNGNKLVLSDGTTYQISPSDSNKVAGWLGAADVTVAPGVNPNYPYAITNTWTGTTVNAQKMDDSSSSTQQDMDQDNLMNQPNNTQQRMNQQMKKPLNQGY